MTAFQKAIDVAMQLLQTSVIDAKKAKLTDTGEAIVKDALTAQVEILARRQPVGAAPAVTF